MFWRRTKVILLVLFVTLPSFYHEFHLSLFLHRSAISRGKLYVWWQSL